MNIQWNKLFITGLVTGILITVIAGSIRNKISGGPESNEILAELDGAKLTREEARKAVAPSLIPVENDEYSILRQSVNQWLNGRLVEKEANAKGISVPAFYAKEIWANVRVTQADVAKFYQQNASLYNQPLERINTQLTQIVREKEYARVEGEVLQRLREKYHAKVHLKEPDSYVQGLAAGNLPSVPSIPGVVPNVPAPAPAAPAPPPAKVNFDDLEGKPSKGPKNAPINLVVFSDFHCPFCSKINPTMEQLMKKYGEKVRVVWRDYPLPMHQGAELTHQGGQCANEQGKFWEYHDKVFATLGGARDQASLVKIAQEVGVKDIKKFENCLSSGKYADYVKKEIAKGSQSGVRGTPAVFVNGELVAGAYPVEHFSGIIDNILDPSKPRPSAPGPSAPRPTPTNVQFNDLAGRPSEGPENAKITLVEFSDFHCPFCKKVEPTVDQLMQNYKGQIRKVWRHYPLPFHQQADEAAEASECAFEQKKFWEYHKLLFDNLGNTKDNVALKNLAKQINGLDTKKFDACLDSGKYKAVVQKDMQKGSEVGVSGTPAIFINGDLVSGAQPYENFDQIVKRKLAA